MRKSAFSILMFAAAASVLMASCGPSAATLEKADPSAPAILGKEYAHELYTHCGVTSAVFDQGRRWRANPPIHDGANNPKAGWGNPTTQGTMVLVQEDLAVFTAESGQVAEFIPLPPDVEPQMCL